MNSGGGSLTGFVSVWAFPPLDMSVLVMTSNRLSTVWLKWCEEAYGSTKSTDGWGCDEVGVSDSDCFDP